MPTNLCPACRRVNANDAKRCHACGSALGSGDTVAMPLRPAPPRHLAGVLWLDDLIAPARGAPAAPTADLAPLAEPEELSITLREIELPSAQPAPAAVAMPAEDLVVSDPGVNVPVLRDALAGPEARHEAGADWQAAQRSAKRAAVRRARLRHAAHGGDEPVVPEVLVLDGDDGARDQLCSLLRGFGFGVHSVGDVLKAAALVASRPFVAAFVDIALDASDGGAGIDLCKHIKAPAAARRPTALLVLVAAQLHPVDRVRAGLAGCDETILKPVSRGSVARVLDGHGIALPSDARRG